MTKKDYIAIAKAINDAKGTIAYQDACMVSSGAKFAMAHIELNIANVFAADNPRFDRARFLTACGVSA